ncbi:LysR substrate-binding domain-containing protein [Pseudomonas typographi]|uniref:LysR family transcriptional regulator n=1 Tax=Pseudomonas typographi TaxID=2715964 RepID=A0ABR7Z2T8_9PSED|nr:LysR substrate-binding domain-containing protein [Pseudomonas typographi]MBD1554127.1 LysR family transcriptional regulator [Pseudomonas typographi]MBD1599805.1 LysR family transcriptional regulator [Pseudomonas typographi]
MRRIPNYASIRAFEAAARLENFAAAADELHLSSSAISHQIRNLETTLGVELFKRHARSVELSAQGRALAQRLIAALDGLESAFTPWMPNAELLTLSVHCAPSFAAKWLSPRLARLVSEPNPLHIRLTSSATPPELTRHEEIDVAITYGRPIERMGVTAEPLGLETIAPLASPHCYDASRMLHTQTLKPRCLIDSQLSPVGWNDWFQHEGLQEPANLRGLSFDRAALVLSAAADGLGIALESVRLAEVELKNGSLIALSGQQPPLQRQMHFLCYRAAMKGSRKIERFKAWLMKQIATS